MSSKEGGKHKHREENKFDFFHDGFYQKLFILGTYSKYPNVGIPQRRLLQATFGGQKKIKILVLANVFLENDVFDIHQMVYEFYSGFDLLKL